MASETNKGKELDPDEQFPHFYRELPVPATPAELESLILKTIDHSPGSKWDPLLIRYNDKRAELADAAKYVNACQRKITEFISADPCLPSPPNLELSRGNGSVAVLNDIVAWCQRASKSRPGKPTKRQGRPPAAEADRKRDARISDAWATREYLTKNDLARALSKPVSDIQRALDRHRKRVERSNND